MSNDAKARRTKITIGGIEVDGFQLPDGSYRMSQTQVAECVGLDERNAREFLRSKAIKSLLGKGYTPAKSDQVEVDPDDQARGQTRISPLSTEEVSAYWLWQAFRGNKAALALCMALITETLERRLDAAFGVERSESERNQLLSQRLQQTEADLNRLGEAYAEPDVLREQVIHLEEQVRQLGGEPWRPPTDDEDGNQ